MTIADDFTADLTHLQQLADTILDTLDTDTNPPVPLVETWLRQNLRPAQ